MRAAPEYAVHYRLRLAIDLDVRCDWAGSEAVALREVEELGRWMLAHLGRPLYPISAIYPPRAERRRPRLRGQGAGQPAP